MGCVVSCCYSFLYFTQQFYESYIRNNKPVQIFIGVVGGMLLMVILLAIFGAFRHPACATSTKNDFYYQLFTRTWAQTTCKENEQNNGKTPCNDKAALPTDITIHGLWPQLRDKNTHFTYCKNSDEFDVTKLSKIKSDLTAQWPTALKQENEVFWKHEWDAHGKCTDLGMAEYFEKTLALNKQYPINTWLKDGGIKPDNVNTYAVEKIQAALNKRINPKQYVLTCVKVKVAADADGKQVEQVWLKDIKLCVRYSDTWALVNCDAAVPGQDTEHDCAGNIYFVADYTKFPTTTAPTTPTIAPTIPTTPVTTPHNKTV